MRPCWIAATILAWPLGVSAQLHPGSAREQAREFVQNLTAQRYQIAATMVRPPLGPDATSLQHSWREILDKTGRLRRIRSLDSLGVETNGATDVVVMVAHLELERGRKAIRMSVPPTGGITSLWFVDDSISRAVRHATDSVAVLAEREYLKDSIGALTMGVWAEGKLAWTGSYGVADHHTLYRIGSVTKMFTALMYLQLVQQHVVSADNPVDRWFPEIRRAGAPPTGYQSPTFGQLATHTAGLATEPDSLDRFLKGAPEHWLDTLIAAMPYTHFEARPGTRYRYSNVGYAILGAALARAAMTPYEVYLREHVLAPLGMTSTVIEPSGELRRRLARGYVIDRGQVDTITPAREHAGRGYKVPNGALYSTLDDLLALVALMLGEAPRGIGLDSTLDTIFDDPTRFSGGLTTEYGVGYEVFQYEGWRFFGHGGAVAGYTAGVVLEPRTRTGVVVLRSAAGGRFDIRELALGSLALVASSVLRGRRE